ncbi:MAG: hypothetical protein D5R96_09330, partial [Methanocalculus sp. MSAO_Arc2]
SMNRQNRGFLMFDRELTIGLSEVGRIIPTYLGISRPTLTIMFPRAMLNFNWCRSNEIYTFFFNIYCQFF